VLGERALGKLVQTTARYICFELPIPMPGIELREPRAKLFKLGWRKSLDGAFDLLDFSHLLSLHRPGRFYALLRTPNYRLLSTVIRH